MAVKHRCRYCGHVLRADGTCQYEKCPRYVPDPEPTTETNDGGNTETEPTP